MLLRCDTTIINKLTNLVIFRTISIIIVGQTYLEILSPLKLINVTPGAHKVSASRAAQASEARLYKLNCVKFVF